MCQDYSQRKLVTISNDMSNQTQWQSLINNLTFIPDAVIVRSVSLSNNETSGLYDGQAVINIWSSLINDVLCSSTYNTTSQPNLYYRLNTNIFGPYIFQARDVDSTAVGIFEGSIMIHLEFVKK
jgi:hypothetical protein